ncbi:hypothetical protein ACLB2K_046770 [Fragaria x ananassa]
MNADGDKEDGEKPKVDDGMYDNGGTTGLHVPKLHHSPLPGYLKQKPWSHQHKQHHRYDHRTPIRHCRPSLFHQRMNERGPFRTLRAWAKRLSCSDVVFVSSVL